MKIKMTPRMIMLESLLSWDGYPPDRPYRDVVIDSYENMQGTRTWYWECQLCRASNFNYDKDNVELESFAHECPEDGRRFGP